MTDYTELKRLADACVAAGEYLPGDAWEEDRNYSPAEEAFLAFAPAATPAAVLALLADLERQSAQSKKWHGSHDRNYCLVADERDQLKAEVEALRTKADCVDDCAHLIRKLVHCRRQLATDGALAEKALDYLKRKGLQGSPLRTDEALVDAALSKEVGHD